jgi:hypothetical protein
MGIYFQGIAANGIGVSINAIHASGGFFSEQS